MNKRFFSLVYLIRPYCIPYDLFLNIYALAVELLNGKRTWRGTSKIQVPKER